MLPEQQQRIMGYFIEEAKDHLNTIEQGLLNLQGTIEDNEMMNEVFRAAHSVKGGAAMLGIGAIQKVAHRLEDYFKVLRDTPVKIDQKLESLFLAVFDALQALLEQLQGPFGLQDEVSNNIMAGVEPVFTNLHTHLEKLAGVSVKSDEIVVLIPTVTQPAVVKPPVRSDRELVTAFQNQIPARLREMLQLFKQPQTAETTQQLKELCSAMGQLGEQYGLSPWCELVETSRLVIANPDNTYRALAPILIKEIKQAQDLVVAGRVAEIITSEKLKELLPVAPVVEVAIEEDAIDLLDIADEPIAEFDPSETLNTQVTSFQDNLFDDPGETAFSVTSIPEVQILEVLAPDTFDGLSSAESIVEPPSYRLDVESNPQPVIEHPGPELEMAELNSLADLFEGEALELGATWQEVEIIGDDSSDSLSILNEFETSRDFSDLLSDAESTDGLSASPAVGDDLASLFGESDLLNEDLDWSEPANSESSTSIASPTLNVVMADGERSGLDTLDNDDLLAIHQLSTVNSTSNDLNDLFAELDESGVPGSRASLSSLETDELGDLFSGSDPADLFDLPADVDFSEPEAAAPEVLETVSFADSDDIWGDAAISESAGDLDDDFFMDLPEDEQLGEFSVAATDLDLPIAQTLTDGTLEANQTASVDLDNWFDEETNQADTLTAASALDVDSDAFFADDDGASAIDDMISGLPDLTESADRLLLDDDADRPSQVIALQPLPEMQTPEPTLAMAQPVQELEIADDPWTNVFDDSSVAESGTPAANSWLDDDASNSLFFDESASDNENLDFLAELESDEGFDFLAESDGADSLDFPLSESASSADVATPPIAETSLQETVSPWEETLVENDRFATTFDFPLESDISSTDLSSEELSLTEGEALDFLSVTLPPLDELNLDELTLDPLLPEGLGEPNDITDAFPNASVVPNVDGSFPEDASASFADLDSPFDLAAFGSLDELDVDEERAIDDSSITTEMDLDSLSLDEETPFGNEESMLAPSSETTAESDLLDLDGEDLFSSDSLFAEDIESESLDQLGVDAASDLTNLDSFWNEEATDTLAPDLSTPELGGAIGINEATFSIEPTSEATVDSTETTFDDLGALLDDVTDLTSASTLSSEGDDFGDLDTFLMEEPDTSTTPAESEDDFGDLDALLNEDDNLISTEPLDENDDFGFGDLDALLSKDDNSLTTVDSNDFADLEAMLAGDSSESATQITAPTLGSSADEDFRALEEMLEPESKTPSSAGGGQSILKARPSNQAGRRKPSSFADQTMRVPVKQLDNLSNLVGELVVNRNSLEQDQERLRQSLDNLLYQVQQLSDVGQRMRDLYERSLLESSLLATRQTHHGTMSGAAPSPEGGHSSGVQFESIEMDRFTPFHTLSQEMIELIVRVRESSSDIEFIVDETDQVTRMFRQVTTQLQESVNRSRMVPFGEIERVFPLARAVRDGAVESGKQAELKIEGKDTLIDKLILERLSDPLKHLVNNAISHGVESPEIRRSLHKGPVGQITIRAFHQGNQTIISFSDDGAGIDIERVKFKAVEKGLITKAESQTMSRLDVYELLYHPGFSTKDEADMRSGRGVGMDVVRKSLDEIRGVITTDSTMNKGTTFTIRLPLTLSISKALRCISNRAQIAFPMDGVEDMLDVHKERVQTNSEGQSCIMWRDNLLPFQPLSDVLKYNRQLGRGSIYAGSQEDDTISIIVLRSAGNFIALQVDQVMGEQEIVIKQLEGPVPKPLGVAGATVMGDGRIMPIADVLELIDLVQGRIRQDSSLIWDPQGAQPLVEVPVKVDPTVLIVDVSITVRELLSMTFNKVGYRVEQARDGQDAWEKLRSGLPCDIVFCDIEMPRMDGLELLSRIQKDPTLNHLPIAMLTSRGADKHRQTAVQLGAKGYFTKPYLEEALLDAAQRMLKGEVLVTSAAQASV